MPRGQYQRKYLTRASHHKSKYEKKRKKIIELVGVKLTVPNLQILPEPEFKDDYYITYFQSKMAEIQSKIVVQEGLHILYISYQGYELNLASTDEDTIVHTRQATIGLIEEMERCGIGMEHYMECITPEGQRKYGLYK